MKSTVHDEKQFSWKAQFWKLGYVPRSEALALQLSKFRCWYPLQEEKKIAVERQAHSFPSPGFWIAQITGENTTLRWNFSLCENILVIITVMMMKCPLHYQLSINRRWPLVDMSTSWICFTVQSTAFLPSGFCKKEQNSFTSVVRGWKTSDEMLQHSRISFPIFQSTNWKSNQWIIWSAICILFSL